jgi:hypothetical protein
MFYQEKSGNPGQAEYRQTVRERKKRFAAIANFRFSEQ